MKKDDCIFCKLANGIIPTNSLYEDDIVNVIFDANPASEGHVLILPKEHFDNIYSLDDKTAAHVFQVAVKVANAINDSLHPVGLNVCRTTVRQLARQYSIFICILFQDMKMIRSILAGSRAV